VRDLPAAGEPCLSPARIAGYEGNHVSCSLSRPKGEGLPKAAAERQRELQPGRNAEAKRLSLHAFSVRDVVPGLDLGILPRLACGSPLASVETKGTMPSMRAKANFRYTVANCVRRMTSSCMPGESRTK
jgi:hypothetical protein